MEQAVDAMRRGVQAYNKAHDIASTPQGGYHETMTVAWMRLLHAVMTIHGSLSGPDEFLDRHSYLLQKRLLLVFYSRDRIMSAMAREQFIEPDLTPFPCPPSASGLG